MKYTKTSIGIINLNLVCTHCGNRVESENAYCSKCGAKLTQIKDVLNGDELIRFLNHHRGELVVKQESPVKTIKGSSDITKTSGRTCPRCKTEADGCEFLVGRICHGICYPTCPPQYDPCVFLSRANS